MSTDETILPIAESFWVIPGRFRAGEYPGSKDDEEARLKLRWLLEQGTNVILDLTEADEAGLIPYSALLQEESSRSSHAAYYLRMPIPDFSTPATEQLAEILDKLDLALSLGRNIYLHCYGGKGRTGTVVGCYLARHGMSGNEALEKLRELRREIPGRDEPSPETEGQKRMVLQWKNGQ